MSDSVYGPTRSFADHVLDRLQIEVEYHDPTHLADLAGRVKAQTKVVYVDRRGR